MLVLTPYYPNVPEPTEKGVIARIVTRLDSKEVQTGRMHIRLSFVELDE